MLFRSDALADLVIGHYEAMLQFYGIELGLKVARKHLGWYLEDAGLAAHRAPILTAGSPATVIRTLRSVFADHAQVAA